MGRPPFAPLEDSSAGYRPSERLLVRAAQIAFFPTGILTTLLGPMLPILIGRWHMTDAQAGRLFLVQFLVMLAGVQLSALLVTRFGFRPAFLLGLLLMAAGVATVYAHSFWIGLSAIALLGLGLGVIIPADNLLIAEMSSASDAAALSLLNFFWGAGAVSCAVSIAWAHEHNILPLFLAGVAILLLALAMGMRRLPFPSPVKPDQARIRWKNTLRMRSTWLFAAVFFLYPGAETSVGGWIGSYVARMGTHPVIAPLMPAFFWVALTSGRGIGSGVLQYLQERWVLRIGFGAGAVGIGCLLWSRSLDQVIGSALITGFSFSTLYPITIARLSRRFGTGARAIGSAMFSMAAVGPAVVPWTVGLVSNATGSLRAGLVVALSATGILFAIHLSEW